MSLTNSNLLLIVLKYCPEHHCLEEVIEPFVIVLFKSVSIIKIIDSGFAELLIMM